MVGGRGSLGSHGQDPHGQDLEHRSQLTHSEVMARLHAQFSGPVPRGRFDRVVSDDRALSTSPISDSTKTETDTSIDGPLFVAIRGERYDGHESLPKLIGTEVRAVVGEDAPPDDYPLPYYRVESTRRALALLAQAFVGDPARHLRIYGVTGTNGKSTTVRILASILEAAGRDVGWMSTVTRRLGEREEAQSLTTPEPHELAVGMRELVDAEGTDLVLEVSSHALDQERVAGLEFDGALLTNLSHDHLDYHGTVDEYLDAKMKLFQALKSDASCVFPKLGAVCADDPRLAALKARFYSVDEEADGYPRQTTCSADGTMGILRLLTDDVSFTSPLIGRHNLENILAAALLAHDLGIEASAIARGVTRAPRVRGRLEEVQARSGRVFVDYAHTPDALQSVLDAVREVTRGRLCVVFGCGGDRDREKRPVMGSIAESLADVVFVTSDNPRGEDPLAIINDVLEGMESRGGVHVEPDRRRAIENALAVLTPDDVLVVAGKGHEQQQLVGKTCLEFDDRAVILDSLERSASG